ncbi:MULTISPECIES: glycoside hydrolase family protein [Sphingobacterium]|uniref:glycoside hydrolase family protein n=1 Tax=Sphingobacterium TaxID=28453 RepID=UPI00240DAB83|nr:glycoside hydrolase family protein [Sphingobacterium sp. WM]WFB63456.1 glycoside hydrolase family protein [Sphingobacterium sp. WM]
MQDRPLTEHRATCMLKDILKGYENDVNRLVRVQLTQNQFDALVSFSFNQGAKNLGKSTLLKMLKINPNDPSIVEEFGN